MFDFNHLHPMIVHFPIALLFIGFLADAIGLIFRKEFFTKAGFYLLIIGTLGVIAAYISGNLAGEGVTEAGSLKQALETHEDAATISLWLMVGVAIVRIALIVLKKFTGVYKWIAFILLLLGVASITRTGYYGGELVYKHAAGVTLDLGFGNFEPTNSENLKEPNEE
jgi:uncharacterized membrane protein